MALNIFRCDKPIIWIIKYVGKRLCQIKVGFTWQFKDPTAGKGIAQERLGLKSGVDRTLVSKIGRQIANPSLEILSEIAAYLEVSDIELLTKKK